MTLQFLGQKTTSSDRTGEILFDLKEHLVAQGWTVQSSGDGVGGFNGSGDVITTASDMSNTRSWYRIQDPVGGREFVFQRGSSAITVRAKYSRAAGFTGGTPSTTDTPSATDEGDFQGGGTDGTPSFGTWVSGGGTEYRYQIVADDTAPYIFAVYGWLVGGTITGCSLFFDVMKSGTELSGDTDPAVMRVSDDLASAFDLVGTNTLSDQGDTSLIDSNSPWGWVHIGEVGELFTTIPAVYFEISEGDIVPGSGGQNPFNGNEYKIPVPYWRTNRTGAEPQWKGISSLIGARASSAVSSFDTLSIDAASDHIVLGETIWPWDGTTPTV